MPRYLTLLPRVFLWLALAMSASIAANAHAKPNAARACLTDCTPRIGIVSAFGEEARAASPQVVLLLTGPNRWVAARASNTLAVIDPETAKRYGIAQQEP